MYNTELKIQAILQSDLVRIRPMQANEFESLFAVASDPLIWELHPQSDRYKREVFLKYFESAIQSGGALVIEDTKDNSIIGASRYYDHIEEKSSIVIGYSFLVRKYWGGTYNREVKKLMLQHAFMFVENVNFEIGENNLRSRRAIEKIGAKLIDQKKLDATNHLIYQIKKTENLLK